MMKVFANGFFILLFCWSFAVRAVSADPSEFLRAQKIIRIYVDSAPGFGHQSAGLSVMTRLREIGFQGEFEVIYQSTVAAKISKIYKAFPHGIPGDVKYLSVEEYQRSLEQKTVTKVNLAVSGADDGFGSQFAKMAQAQTYLRLQPLGWGQSQLYGRQSRVLHGLSELPLASLNDTNPDEFQKKLSQDLVLDPAKKEFLFRFATQGFSEFNFPIYGVGIQAYAAQRMFFYSKALRTAAQRLDQNKAIIVPVVSPFNAQEMDAIEKAFGKKAGFESAAPGERAHQNKMHLLMPAEFNSLSSLKPGNIYFVFVGSVPQYAFNLLYEKANLPVWVAGKNAMSFTLTQGKAYLNTVNDYYLPGRSGLSSGSQKIMDQAYEAFSVGYQEYAHQNRLRDLGKFIVEASREGSELRQYFANIGKQMTSNDKVLEALRYSLGAPSVIMCREILSF